MAERKPLPDFETQEEAAQWYAHNQEAFNQLAVKALEGGKAKRRSQILKERAAEAQGTIPVTIRLPVVDVEKARKHAKQKGLRYQTYIKMLLHEALAGI